MAKKKAGGATRSDAQGENISAYFRRVFQQNPKLLEGRSNEELLRRWLADHPGQTEVPQPVKNGLQNVKGILRSKGRKRKAARPAAAAPAAQAPARPTAGKGRLEQLEELIDEVLTFARAVDPEGLESVIGHLRRARNEVVWKLGE